MIAVAVALAATFVLVVARQHDRSERAAADRSAGDVARPEPRATLREDSAIAARPASHAENGARVPASASGGLEVIVVDDRGRAVQAADVGLAERFARDSQDRLMLATTDARGRALIARADLPGIGGLSAIVARHAEHGFGQAPFVESAASATIVLSPWALAHVTLVDAEGALVHDATFSLPTPEGTDRSLVVARVASGRYRIEGLIDGQSTLFVRAPGYASRFVEVIAGRPAPEVTRVLDRETIVDVEVLDERGADLPDASVAWTHTIVWVDGVRDGTRWRLRGVTPREPLLVRVACEGYMAARVGDLGERPSDPVVVRLTRSATIEVRVEDGAGHSGPFHVVAVDLGRDTLTTTLHGGRLASARADDGVARLHVAHGIPIGIRVQATDGMNARFFASAVLGELAAGEVRSEAFRIVWADLSGTLRHADGRPIGGSVSISDETGRGILTVDVAGDGRFDLRIPSGKRKIAATSRGMTIVRTLEVAGKVVADFTFTGLRSIRGRLVSSRGVAVPATVVTAHRFAQLVASTISDDEGRFVLVGVPPGPVTIRSREGALERTLATTRDDDVGDVPFETSIVRIVTRDWESGRAMPAAVTFQRQTKPGTARAWSASDSRGECELRLWPGDWSFSADGVGIEVELGIDDRAEPVTCVVPIARACSFRWERGGERARAGTLTATARRYGMEWRRVMAVDAERRTVLTLPPGEVRLVLRTDEGEFVDDVVVTP